MSTPNPISNSGSYQSFNIDQQRAEKLQKSFNNIPPNAQDYMKAGMAMCINLQLMSLRKGMLEQGKQPVNVPFQSNHQDKQSDFGSLFDSADYLILWLQANNQATMSDALSGQQQAEEIKNVSGRMNTEVTLMAQMNNQALKDQEQAADIAAKSNIFNDRTKDLQLALKIAGGVLFAVAIACTIATAVATGGATLGPSVTAILAVAPLITSTIGGICAATSAGTAAIGYYEKNQILTSPDGDFNKTSIFKEAAEDILGNAPSKSELQSDADVASGKYGLNVAGYKTAAAQAQSDYANLQADMSVSKNEMSISQKQYQAWTDDVQSSLEDMGSVFDAMKQMSQAV
ncbi:MAG: hypothetical protein JHC93_02700 [Parachlamydiales bacterium]|nr:hypothetical protein [Parachlamydiales bacterium]